VPFERDPAVPRAFVARRAWRGFAERDADAIVAAAGEDVLWRPSHARDGLRGHAALVAYFAGLAREGVRQEAVIYAAQEDPGGVLLTGTLRDVRSDGHREAQCAWAYRFEDDVLVEGVVCTDEDEARRVRAGVLVP
jgi:predicted SnoaL-like aldol condensation-catalyzing enzyme